MLRHLLRCTSHRLTADSELTLWQSSIVVAQILVVEDEMSIADALVFALETDGWNVRWLRLGREALEAATDRDVELIILDVGLPDLNGFEVCKAIRKHSDVPIVFLTARGEEIDRIVGLEIGADDYVVKPFSPREVAARVRVILRRARPRSTPNEHGETNMPPATPTHDQGFDVNTEAYVISYLGTPLQLTPHEFRLLAHLLQNPGRVYSRGQLLEVIGAGTDPVYERNIDTHVKALRAKLREVNSAAEPIQTHRGFGYSYRAGES